MKKLTVPSILLCTVFVLSAVTLLVTDRFLSRRALDEAERYNYATIDYICAAGERQNLIVERAARSFLLDWFGYPQSDSVYYSESPMVIKDKDIKRFSKEVYGDLLMFMKANDSRYESCLFLVLPGIVNDSQTEYFVPYVSEDGQWSYDAGKDLVEYTSLMDNVMKFDTDTWIVPDKKSPLRDVMSTSYFLPLLREDGSRFGAFSINVTIEGLRKTLLKYLPYKDGECELRVEDRDGNTICSTDTYNAEGKSHVFRRGIKNTPFDIIVVVSDRAIYSRAHSTISFITTVAFVGMILIALLTMLTFKSIRRQERKIAADESEIRLAADVQKQLLRIPGEASGDNFALKAWIKPAQEAGGDLYDYVIKGSDVIFIVGDVSGKGMSAAMFMTQVCSIFRSYSASTGDPAEITTHLNAILSEGNSSVTFCTLVVGLLDTSSGKLTLCNAGHNPPVLVKNGVPSFLTLKPGIPVAIEETMTYENDVITLEDSDSIFLYTDGVTEARNASHGQFGEQRLLDSISGHGPSGIEYIAGDIRSFAGAEPQSDDITMLVCTYNETSA